MGKGFLVLVALFISGTVYADVPWDYTLSQIEGHWLCYRGEYYDTNPDVHERVYTVNRVGDRVKSVSLQTNFNGASTSQLSGISSTVYPDQQVSPFELPFPLNLESERPAKGEVLTWATWWTGAELTTRYEICKPEGMGGDGYQLCPYLSVRQRQSDSAYFPYVNNPNELWLAIQFTIDTHIGSSTRYTCLRK